MPLQVIRIAEDKGRPNSNDLLPLRKSYPSTRKSLLYQKMLMASKALLMVCRSVQAKQLKGLERALARLSGVNLVG